MKQTSVLRSAAVMVVMAHIHAAALVLVPPVSPWTTGRHHRDVQNAVASVCKPAPSRPADTIPPCIEIEVIEARCWPNGTEAVHYDGHQQCMCTGSFFDDWAGCQKCLYAHGFRNARDMEFYSSIMLTASRSLCTGTPKTAFQFIYASVAATATPVATGDVVYSDRYPGRTDVAAYYTASRPQGAGIVTGPAATAVRPWALPTAGPLSPNISASAVSVFHTPSIPASSISASATSPSENTAQPRIPSGVSQGIAFVVGGIALGVFL